MFQIKQPSHIIIGENSSKKFQFPENCLVITSSGSRKRNWLEHLEIENYLLFEDVEPNPSIETTKRIIEKFSDSEISCIVGLGGGSSLDVSKFIAQKLKKKKLLIPTTFGSGSEVTRIAVLNVNGKKTSFHDDNMFADVAIIDPFFIHDTPLNIIKNSAIDACAQCTEGFDSKLGNLYTKFLCNNAFDILENAILNEKYELLPLGSLISGLGFGNCSTTLGHALSYVFSNEGYSHGHALAFTTQMAHKFNSSRYESRFKNIVETLGFEKIHLLQNLSDASDLILNDNKHIDNNPKPVMKENIIKILETINSL
jgi:succinate semialdehyde reductase|tara:strand:+ start:2853 stop:3788 length:936 start_codon:yes stop_codon:yes gene_type:complete